MPVLPLLLAAVAPLHFYSGNGPGQWTTTVYAAPSAAAPADFSAFPCNASDCSVARILTDAGGNTYVVGSRYFVSQWTGGGLVRTSDVFVAKLDPSGAPLFLATFSGKGSDEGRAIALDPAGNIWVGGSTTSLNFPVRNAIQPERGSGGSGFLVKLSPDGSQLLFSSYFGGMGGPSGVNALATDSAGNVYVTGQTGAQDFPVSPGMPAGAVHASGPGAIFAAFVAKLAPAGERILYSGRISGNSVQCGAGSTCFLSTRNITGVAIALDGAGNAYVAGNANVTDLPTTEGVLARQGIGAWVARVKASGAGLDYLTYLGAANYVLVPFANPANLAAALAVDAAGNAYIAGSTNDPAFPATPGAAQPVYGGPAAPPPVGPGPPRDAFLAKLNPQGTAMVYATFLGGPGEDAATAVALDAAGSAWVAGTATLSEFLVSRPVDFIYALNPAGSALAVRAHYPRGAVSRAIAVDRDGRVRAAGETGVVSSFSPAAAPAARLFGMTSAAGRTPLGPALAPGEVISLFGTLLGPEEGAVASAVGGKIPFELAGTRVLIDGLPAPLLYVSRDQVNAVAPFALTPGKRVTIRVTSASGAAPDFPGVVVTSRPRVFSSTGGAAALNEDGTINTQANPARAASVVSVWATGVGTVSPLPADAEIADAARQYYCCTVSVGEKAADLLYSGAAPGLVAGIVQVNFRLPADLDVSGVRQVPFRLAASPPAAEDPAASDNWIWVRP